MEVKFNKTSYSTEGLKSFFEALHQASVVISGRGGGGGGYSSYAVYDYPPLVQFNYYRATGKVINPWSAGGGIAKIINHPSWYRGNTKMLKVGFPRPSELYTSPLAQLAAATTGNMEELVLDQDVLANWSRQILEICGKTYDEKTIRSHMVDVVVTYSLHRKRRNRGQVRQDNISKIELKIGKLAREREKAVADHERYLRLAKSATRSQDRVDVSIRALREKLSSL